MLWVKINVGLLIFFMIEVIENVLFVLVVLSKVWKLCLVWILVVNWVIVWGWLLVGWKGVCK